MRRVLFALRNLGPGPHKKPSQITTAPVKDPFEQGFDKEAATSDPFADPNGPFYHNVKLATSSDGMNFTDTGRVHRRNHLAERDNFLKKTAGRQNHL